MHNSFQTLPHQMNVRPEQDETTWSLPGGIIGFASWLLALACPFLIYGPNTLFLLLYTWPFFLALMPVAVIIGVAMHSLLARRLVWCAMATLIVVGILSGTLFLWLTC